MNHLEALRTSGRQFLLLAESLDRNELAAASVCEGWTLEDIVRHVLNGCRMSVALASGSSAAQAVEARERPIIGPLVTELGQAIEQQQAAMEVPSADGFIAHHPIVDMTMRQLAETRVVEFIVHGSDIARSTGKTHEADAAAVEVAWAAMAPLADVTAALGVFGSGPSGQLSDTATAMERLLDVTGRASDRSDELG